MLNHYAGVSCASSWCENSPAKRFKNAKNSRGQQRKETRRVKEAAPPSSYWLAAKGNFFFSDTAGMAPATPGGYHAHIPVVIISPGAKS
jgi:hypothetical protein